MVSTVVPIAPLKADEMPEFDQYVLRCDIYEGTEIPDRGDMHVELAIGANVFATKTTRVEDGRCKWYQEISKVTLALSSLHPQLC